MAENRRQLREREPVNYNAKNFASTPAWLKVGWLAVRLCIGARLRMYSRPLGFPSQKSSTQEDAHSPELGDPSSSGSGRNPLGPSAVPNRQLHFPSGKQAPTGPGPQGAKAARASLPATKPSKSKGGQRRPQQPNTSRNHARCCCWTCHGCCLTYLHRLGC
jgi:hypothetical protein